MTRSVEQISQGEAGAISAAPGQGEAGAISAAPGQGEPGAISTSPGQAPGRVPDFFIVGHAKCGTTALYEMLRSHPEIFMPDLKEPEFLAGDMRRLFRPPMAGPLPATLDQYTALFAGARGDQRAGEASAFYLSSRTAAASVAELNPAARVIAIFREPAAFLRSLHLQLLQDHVESQRDLRRAIALEPRRREGRSIPRRSYRPQALRYSEHVRYSEQLCRYHAVLPREQVLVLLYDELRRDNAATVRRIYRFLGVDDAVPIHPRQANPTVALRSQALDDAVHRLSVGRGRYSRATKAVIKSLVPGPVRRGALAVAHRRVVHSPAPPVDEKLMAELRAWCRPEVERFGAYLERDLVSVWGYGRVD